MNDKLIGYHGTSVKYATDILRSKQYHISGSYRDWLGKGVYFFAKDPHQAYMFSKVKNKLNECDIKVLYTEIDTQRYNLFDLTVDEDKQFLYEYSRELARQIKAKQSEIGEWSHIEGYVLDILYERTHCYDVVCAPYHVPNHNIMYQIFDFADVQIQICVKNTDSIIEQSIKEVNCDDYRRS